MIDYLKPSLVFTISLPPLPSLLHPTSKVIGGGGASLVFTFSPFLLHVFLPHSLVSHSLLPLFHLSEGGITGVYTLSLSHPLSSLTPSFLPPHSISL